MHPKAAAAAAAAAAVKAAAAEGSGTDDGVGGGVGVGIDNVGTDVSASLPDPGPGFIPPHIYASTYSTYSTGSAGGFMEAFIIGNGQGIEGGGGIGSMMSGRGHTLKGRDALKARTAILRQTGFVEPDRSPSRSRTPGVVGGVGGGGGELLLDLEPRTSTPAIVVAGDVAGREGFNDRSPP